jgi:hypothetical protein
VSLLPNTPYKKDKHMTLPNIYVDFHNADAQGRYRLNTVGTLETLNDMGTKLQEGLQILLTDTQLEVEGMVMYSEEESMWVAQPIGEPSSSNADS